MVNRFGQAGLGSGQVGFGQAGLGKIPRWPGGFWPVGRLARRWVFEKNGRILAGNFVGAGGVKIGSNERSE